MQRGQGLARLTGSGSTRRAHGEKGVGWLQLSQAWIKFHFPSEEFPENPPLLLLWVLTSCRASGGSSL